MRFFLEVSEKVRTFAQRKPISDDKGVRNKRRKESCFQAFCRSPQGMGRPYFWQYVDWRFQATGLQYGQYHEVMELTFSLSELNRKSPIAIDRFIEDFQEKLR